MEAKITPKTQREVLVSNQYWKMGYDNGKQNGYAEGIEEGLRRAKEQSATQRQFAITELIKQQAAIAEANARLVMAAERY